MLVENHTDNNKEYKRIKRFSDLNLESYDLQEEFDELINLAASIAGTQFCKINLIDNHFQWTVASENSEFKVIAREESVCNVTIKENSPLEIKRLDQDIRFKDKVYVNCQNGLKYYLGIPLTLNSGDTIGALCMFDSEEKNITPNDLGKLNTIAAEIVRRLELINTLDNYKVALAETEKNMKRLAHDVRSPLSGISRLCEVLDKDEISSSEIYSYLVMISETSSSILNLTDDILSKDQGHKQTYDLQELGDRLNSLYVIPAKTKNLDFQVSFSEKNGQTRFLKKKLFSAAGNLISNSIKFTPEGGWVRVRLDIAKKGPEERLIITVTDNGIGILNSLPKNQDIFDRNSEDGRDHNAGHGLGLQLVREEVENCSGEIFIDAGKKSGTEIRLEIPIF